MSVPAGYSITPAGFYFHTDGSGPYAMDSLGGMHLLGSGESSGGGGGSGGGGSGGDPDPDPIEQLKLSRILEGGGAAYVSGLTVNMAAIEYQLLGTLLSAPETQLTFDAADGSNPRYDVVVVNAAGAYAIVKGTAAATPVIPDVDENTQLFVTWVYIPAAAVNLPVNATKKNIYDENTEWTTARSGAQVTIASANTPIAGAVSVEFTAAANGDYIRFTDAADLDLASYDNLVFKFKNKAQWPAGKVLHLGFYTNGGARRGVLVPFAPGDFGTSPTLLTAQQVVIPTHLFGANGLAVRRLQMTLAGTVGGVGFFIDTVALQGGQTQVIDSERMRFRGDWNSVSLYLTNDAVVTSTGELYVAVAPNSASEPSPTNTNWKLLNSGLQTIQFACSDLTTNLAAGTDKGYVPAPYDLTVVGAQMDVKTAQTAGSVLTFDINDSGVSILSTKCTIDNNETSSNTAATPPVISDTLISKGAPITVDFDQVGTAGAKGAVCTLTVKRR